MTFIVRGVRPADWPDVARIAYATGFFGASARRYFPDEALFGALWVGPYALAGADALGFVAEWRGRTVGYILGTTTFSAYRAGFRALAPQLAMGAARGAYPQLAGCVPYLTRAGRFALPHAPEAAFPAHLHLNLSEDARGLGAGGALLDAYLDALRARAVPGVQLSTTARNEAAVALYTRRGFGTLEARRTPLWRPWLGEDALHLTLGRALP
ncbi:GNAT family N-acetyltransferase [Deinococcus maricopensis]|uniref:GCN5-related N-acetyltransferase n=1 Tax=Deinococcus maricopensis (strain DSM 21211 / LMG 22137 / NRRL B-23946 / LB-34) TaxID=709986 RepID=E8U6N3_DEIML|nr:GNAT family N-acetyltransferase [Deinococcus maricopensis]ADV66722.1 GCN5-related N-acetyltransferase [Deinococcus maricopensis DSM 21211]